MAFCALPGQVYKVEGLEVHLLVLPGQIYIHKGGGP